MSVDFHPAVARWFERRFEGPTPPQAEGWPAIRAGRHTLIAAPTGSGKTLAAFLTAIDELVQRGLTGDLPDAVQVLYISPLKALGNDVEKNLQEPLAGIRDELARLGLPDVPIRTAVRSGDTKPSQRAAMTKRPPHIFVTTPESLAILLTSEGGRRMLRDVRTVIIDEIHALVRDKRGSHLSLSLERLRDLVGHPPLRVGLSATQRPIEEVARFLVGADSVDADNRPDCTIIDGGHARELDLALELPDSPLASVMSNDEWDEVHDRIAALVDAHRTTLVFVNTRKVAERSTGKLAERLGEDRVTAHHGSLAREHRLEAERRLKAGELSCLIATASLELGIDIGDVDLVCQLGSPHSISAFVQRVGRSGHQLRGVPKGRLFPMSRDDLVECSAILHAVRRGELDRLHLPEAPLDILAQQMVAEVAAIGEEGVGEDALFASVRRAWPYRALPRERFDAVAAMVAEGFSTQRGRRGAFLHRDEVNARLRPRRSARLSAITSGGAIPDNFDYEVRLEPAGVRVGSLNEDFATESMAGDIFQLGNASYRILRIEAGTVRVADARGMPPSIPFWLGEAPSRSDELSAAVSELREAVAERFAESDESALRWAADSNEGPRLGAIAARQLVDYLGAASVSLGAIPSQRTLVMERFFDETGGMHLVLHSPFGSRMNRAWGLALRKRFCRGFNVELQAAATEDAIVLSLGPTHSFPLEEVFAYLREGTVRDLLVQALLDAPMFQTRWRWNSTRALAVLRFRGGKKVPPRFQRMDADDLLAVCFPDQVACLENVTGDREIPDHPLVAQTIDDCLVEAMDITKLEEVLGRIGRGEIHLMARDLTEPSPLAQEILNAKPYAFLDDAPIEERRTQAVLSRRWLDPRSASDLGALDAAAIERVIDECRPDPRDAEELHDALIIHAFLTPEDAPGTGTGTDPTPWTSLLDTLRDDGRATRLQHGATSLWIAAERLPEWLSLYPDAKLEPPIEAPPRRRAVEWTPEDALREIVRGRLEAVGPITAAEVAASADLDVGAVDAALTALESEGFVLRGSFRAPPPGGAPADEFCERRLLARVHRYTLDRLRREIEPVSAADFIRFLVRWQHADAEGRMEGPEGLAAVVEQLDGYEAAAASWESDLLPLRLRGYDPSWLDSLCLAGRVGWARRTPPAPGGGGGARGAPVRSTPIALFERHHAASWLALAEARRHASPASADAEDEGGSARRELSADAAAVWECLSRRGACFVDDVVREAGLLRTQVEAALAELVAEGRVTSDGFSGLRGLLIPASRRGRPLPGRRGRRSLMGPGGMPGAGRWSALEFGAPAEESLSRGGEEAVDLEMIAWALLRRWGVVFRRVLERETGMPPWRDLLRLYRRLEAKGLIRGGRFVEGFTGEQFALPEAVGSLRKLRRKRRQASEGEPELVSVSGSDPLNLLGILTPDARLPSKPKNRLLYRDGVPVAVREGGALRFLVDVEPEERWKLETALTRRRIPDGVRAYLGHGA